MKKIFKGSLSVLLVLIMVTGLFSSLSITASAGIVPGGNGNCGKNNPEDMQFTMYDDNILVISGTGEMQDYTSTNAAPWSGFYFYTSIGFMQKIVLANGVESVGDYAFSMDINALGYEKYTVNLINLPDSLKKIGQHAFSNVAKIEYITIPQNVESIGEQAFEGCTQLKVVNLYADPTKLYWDIANSGLQSKLEANTIEIHVLKDQLSKYQKKYPSYSDDFVGDLVEPTNLIPAGKHILVSYEDPSPRIFAGALPYSIKSVNEKGTWPITYGARGFVTCIKDGNKYYALTNNNSGTLKELTITNDVSAKATGVTDNVYGDVTLKITHEYVGANSIKMIYTVKNNTNGSKSFQLGSSGDIKIGLDDYATISPLKIDENQIGITMTSALEYDKIKSKAPTLGFTAKEIAGSQDANFFYGVAVGNASTSATAVKSDVFMPSRIFEKHDTNSIETEVFNPDHERKDSGLSFYWDVSLEANKEKQFAVIFSVPNTASGDESKDVLEEVKGNFTTNTTGIYSIASPPSTYVFNNEIIPQPTDELAQKNNYSTLRNFVILGVQKKPEMTHRNCMRFVTVVNTNILKDADEYGYIIAKQVRTNENTYKDIREKIGQIELNKANTYHENIKATSNKISGDFGDYNTETPYKYVTLGLNDIPDDVVFIVRFYVKKGTTIQYADYFDNNLAKHDGCSADWGAIANLS